MTTPNCPDTNTTWHPKGCSCVTSAIARFPTTFGLRAHEGTFRISPDSSYVNDRGVVMLYTQREANGRWLDFAKGTESELRAQIINR